MGRGIRGPGTAEDPWVIAPLKGARGGRFGNYVPPVLEHLGLADVEHEPRNNRMRAK
jgi:hypothetical protein